MALAEVDRPGRDHDIRTRFDGTIMPTHSAQRRSPRSAPPASRRRAGPPPAKLLLKQFFTIVAIDPNKAGLEVARIMNGLLVELTRTMGSELRLTLEVEGASAEEVYPDDAVEIVKANAGDLKRGEESFGFDE